jgi:hypothetical protein
MLGTICCCKKKVLLWLTNNLGPIGTYSDLTTVYTDMGKTVDDNTTWSGVLDDYSLIHFPIALSDPSWWGSISGGTWAGRLHITAENNTSYAGSVTYVNGKSGITGISVTGDSIDAVCDHDGTAESDPMTSGLSLIKYAFTSQVASGTTLSKTVTGSHPWLARNTVGSIDFIVAGDANHAADSCNVANGANKALFQNMYNL